MELSLPKLHAKIAGLEDFARDVDAGLSADKKYLSPKYFYDAEGDRLFREIMAMPEYYLTKTELGILTNYRDELLGHFAGKGQFGLIELGAGDGMKTKVLLRHFIDRGAKFHYSPIDISRNALAGLVRSVSAEFPVLEIKPLPGDYFATLARIGESPERKIVLFLGASIGNFAFEEALSFLKKLRTSLAQGDMVLIGFDLKKNPMEILSAYNDSRGITRDFNLNLLTRMNRELDADFKLENFGHYPMYDPQSGEAKSFLVSLKEQVVSIGKLEKYYKFLEGETIHTEISRKYSIAEIELLAELAGFKTVRNFTDPNNRFVDALWKC